ncbi:hypothetical protein [Ktedonobacter racemifer]|uniref:Uncharacterized protein n=1 Tax=Ktedonobacter racemifer DSM 44963 TaxID=485913 RepID=D6TNC9_KTERA|nr:hypothetical protein [Ktedonobacter racemifer]EFH87260.1 hypothetical protein Krac_8590 [Ktedonobacter racemifer DSM 44963]
MQINPKAVRTIFIVIVEILLLVGLIIGGISLQGPSPERVSSWIFFEEFALHVFILSGVMRQKLHAKRKAKANKSNQTS